MRILFWKIGAIGDVAMTTPLVRQVRAMHPSATIDYFVGNTAAAVLAGNPHLSSVISFDEGIFTHRRLARLGELIRILREYDVVYILDKHWIFGLVARLAGVGQRIGFARGREGLFHTHRAAYGMVRHEMHYYLDLAKAAGLEPDYSDTRPDVPVDRARIVPGDYVVLCNAGGDNIRERSTVRRMPPGLFAQLVVRVAETNRVVFVGTDAERSLYPQQASERFTNLCGQLSLAQSIAVLRDAQWVITTDSGLMHLAGAVNGHVTAVLGPTQPARVCPPGATWVWEDAFDYEDDYSVHGVLPKGKFFRSVSVDVILAAASQIDRGGIR